MIPRIFAVVAVLGLSLPAVARTRGTTKDSEKAMTLQEALDSAERALDNGGDPSDISARLHKTRGLSKDELRRLDLIDARCALIESNWQKSEKLLAGFHKASPDDARITEWYARALDGSGKGDSALPLLKQLADNDGLHDGDSYWALAQLERKQGNGKSALVHAKAALSHPIVLQSDELDKEIHKFIAELDGKK
jgi:hypothetical protein